MPNPVETIERLSMRAVLSKTLNEKGRTAEFVASTNEVDRYGTIILPSAFKALLPKFARHSPFLAAHAGAADSAAPTQIGTVKEISIEATRVTIRVAYAKTALAEQYWLLASDPEQSVAVSIGFIPHATVKGTPAELTQSMPELAAPLAEAGVAADERIVVYTRLELLEVSQVSVPANSQAIQLSGQNREPGARSQEDSGPAPGSRLPAPSSDPGAAEQFTKITELLEGLRREVEEMSFVLAALSGGRDALEPATRQSPAGEDSSGAPPARQPADNGEAVRQALRQLVEAMKPSTN